MLDLKIPEKRYRTEIEGLRTIATILIAIYHIWLGKVSGGVDVFFVLSGFLITMSLISKIERTGKIHFGEYLLGLAKRLFPLALTVIIFIAGLSIFLLPRVQWEQIISHMFASTLFFENWRLSLDAVDYLAQDNVASPFQHFWSMSVQGQFYILWPCLIFLAYILARKVLKSPVRKTLLVVLLIVFILSLSYSIYITNLNQPWAYFDLLARIWEFSLGGIFAILLPYLSLNKWLSTFIGWIGLLIVCFTGVIIPVSDLFPGYIALLPIGGALLLILSAESSTRFGVDKILGAKPFLFFGRYTYGFYLWHWPLLIFYKVYMDTSTVSIEHGLLILLATFILSYVSTQFIETPIHKIDVRQSKSKLVFVLSLMLFPVLLMNYSFNYFVEQEKAQKPLEYSIQDYPGALAFQQNIQAIEGVELIPSMVNVKTDLPSFYDDKQCFSNKGTVVTKCSFGVTDDPDYIIALVGGSHSGHWFPALEILAEELNFQIDVYIRDGCRFTNDDFGGQVSPECLAWNEKLMDVLIKDPPDLVFAPATLNNRDTVPIGYIGQWSRLEGITQIFAVRDNPRMAEDGPTCIERVSDPAECSVPKDQGVSEIVPWENTDGIPSNVTFADLTDNFCDESRCYGVIGNIIVYRDKHHITAEYAKTLAPALKEPLADALNSLDKK
ncbi:acyltransferase family protein [Lysinibacillus sp. NPDC096418]|uniref:acyltransferase family protein n=1 Tax=Lysinibacillus sp. NPDC096418 TaxID=3364138 RepID=UPI0038138B3D